MLIDICFFNSSFVTSVVQCMQVISIRCRHLSVSGVERAVPVIYRLYRDNIPGIHATDVTLHIKALKFAFSPTMDLCGLICLCVTVM